MYKAIVVSFAQAGRLLAPWHVALEDSSLIRRQTITAQVITHILGLIKRGEVKPGERLPTEKQLTEQLSVSRTCVREAIKSLQSLQLISVRPKIGAVVFEPSPGRAHQCGVSVDLRVHAAGGFAD